MQKCKKPQKIFQNFIVKLENYKNLVMVYKYMKSSDISLLFVPNNLFLNNNINNNVFYSEVNFNLTEKLSL